MYSGGWWVQSGAPLWILEPLQPPSPLAKHHSSRNLTKDDEKNGLANKDLGVIAYPLSIYASELNSRAVSFLLT
jgi:hypothetical protein